MPHLHTEPGQHDLTVSAYIIRLDTAEPSLMLHKHKLLDKYLQFGGHVELHENPWAALTHELLEESGYTMQQLKVLQPTSRLTKVSNAILHPTPANILTHAFGNLDHYHTDIAYAFVTHEAPSATIGDGESTDIKLLTAQELAALSADKIPENVREIGLYALDSCLTEWTNVNAADFST